METLTHPSPFRDEQSSDGATAADEPKRSSKRRKACNECKQQKLRCDLAAGDTCRRCTRLQLECKIEDGFRRTRKRRRSCDLENEIQELRAQLDQLRDHATPVSVSTLSQPVSALQWPVETTTNAVRVTLSYDSPARQSVSPSNPGPGPLVSDDSHVPSSSTTERAHLPNLTTRPGIDESVPRYLNTQTLPRPRALGNIVLSVEEIDELFNIYLTYYHPFLPLIDPSKSPHEYYQSSELLFWSILSVASRRLKSQPTLLPRLARNVPDLLWKTVRCVPYSVLAIQGIALLCTWPFPTSSSTTDPTFMLAGILLQTGTQMGLHRAIDAPDFSKIRRRLNIMEHAEWTRTWEACNIVAHSVSVGSGLPLIIQTYDWLQHPRVEVSPQENATGMSFTRYMRIERFRHRVSSSLAWHLRGLEVSAHEKLTLYRLLNSDFIALELEEPQDNSYTTWHLLAARLHLQAFFLLDDAALDGYTDRIITLYLTAYSLVEKSLWLDVHSNGFLEFCPFFCYQVFVCASFVILKILSNGFFRSKLEIKAGTKLLESAIAALRKISVVNNDLPARLGDVIGFFCTLPDPTSVGGVLAEHVRLQKVRNRLSMSVVYDCLWTWRRHFQLNDDDRTSHNRFYCSEESAFDINNVQNIFGFDFPFDTIPFADLDQSL